VSKKGGVNDEKQTILEAAKSHEMPEVGPVERSARIDRSCRQGQGGPANAKKNASGSSEKFASKDKNPNTSREIYNAPKNKMKQNAGVNPEILKARQMFQATNRKKNVTQMMPPHNEELKAYNDDLYSREKEDLDSMKVH
jgi:hypothetical protein